MSRCSVVVGLLFAMLVGCRSSTDTPHSDGVGLIDYAGWPELTDKPVRVSYVASLMCSSDSAGEYQRKHGPHFVPAIRVYANVLAAEHLRESCTGPLPVGSVIIKEKWLDEKDARPDGYAAMIKREPGYDPEHRDWEYLYVRLTEKEKLTRGKIQSCIDCHAGAAGTDYLFRPYLKDAK